MNIDLHSIYRLKSLFMKVPALVCVLLLTISSAFAQSDSNNVPRMANGKPDLTGVWGTGGVSFINPVVDEEGNVKCIVGCASVRAEEAGDSPAAAVPAAAAAPAAAPAPRGPDRPRYKPEYIAKVQDLNERQVETDPALRCINPGLPRIGPPSAIVQRPDQVVFLYDDLNGSFFRMIPTDGRGHWDNPETTYLGDSIGYWDGDTLVVEATNFNDITWLIDDGSFHTDKLRVTERYTRVGDTLQIATIVEDPDVLAEPWNMRPRTLVLDGNPMMEPIPCVEQDLDHIVDGTHHDNAR